MHALLSKENTKPLIVNEESQQYAELLCAGYTPIKEGTKKKLQEIIQDTLEEDVQDFSDWD